MMVPAIRNRAGQSGKDILMTTNKTARWYLIQTKPRQEARAE